MSAFNFPQPVGKDSMCSGGVLGMAFWMPLWVSWPRQMMYLVSSLGRISRHNSVAKALTSFFRGSSLEEGDLKGMKCPERDFTRRSVCEDMPGI